MTNDELRNKASELYGNDDNLSFDADADISEAEDGAWVAAWVWVGKDEKPSEPKCETCGGTGKCEVPRTTGSHAVVPNYEEVPCPDCSDLEEERA